MEHKVVINACYGGFELSDEAVLWLKDNCQTPEFQKLFADLQQQGITGIKDIVQEVNSSITSIPIARHNDDLINCVETLGTVLASNPFSKLKVVPIRGHLYKINEYDGYETITQPDDTEGWSNIYD